MSIPCQQIGLDQQSKLLVNISKQIERLTAVIYNITSGGSTIQNQNSSAQVADLWINGSAKAGTFNGLSIINNGTNILNIAAGQSLIVPTGGTLGTAAYTASTAYEVPLTFNTGLTRTINTITNTLITGLAGGQTIIGSTGVSNGLILKATSGNGTLTSPGISLNVGNNGVTNAVTVLNNGDVGFGIPNPLHKVHVLTPTASAGTNLIVALFDGEITSNDGTSILRLTTSGGTRYTDIEQNAGGGSSAFRFSSTYNDTNIYNNGNTTSSPYGNINFITGNATSSIVMTIGGGSQKGNVGIGMKLPTAVLNLKAGTATAGTSPLKFTISGAVLLTTPELGVLEPDSTGLYYTPTGIIREKVHTGGGLSITLTAGTTTTVTDVTARTTSRIILSPTSSTAITVAPYVSTKNNGSFVITTSTAAGTETLDYIIVN